MARRRATGVTGREETAITSTLRRPRDARAASGPSQGSTTEAAARSPRADVRSRQATISSHPQTRKEEEHDMHFEVPRARTAFHRCIASLGLLAALAAAPGVHAKEYNYATYLPPQHPTTKALNTFLED